MCQYFWFVTIHDIVTNQTNYKKYIHSYYILSFLLAYLILPILLLLYHVFINIKIYSNLNVISSLLVSLKDSLLTTLISWIPERLEFNTIIPYIMFFFLFGV
jgi:hypothetical protein